MKNSIDTSWDRTSDLPICSTAIQQLHLKNLNGMVTVSWLILFCFFLYMIPVTTPSPTQSYTCVISYSANPHCKSLSVPDM